MSKKARQKNKIKRDQAKKARRMANQAKYQALAAEGKNKKSKRHVLSTKRKRASNDKHQHRSGYCGNLACFQCFPRDALGNKRVKGPTTQPAKPNRWQVDQARSLQRMRDHREAAHAL